MQPYELTATQASKLIKEKTLSCEELARSTLDHIEKKDVEVRAFVFVDRDMVLRNARKLDRKGARGPREARFMV
ncbi:MAG: hypothetical protein ACRYHA_15680 [Janthinobacterium lividum]